MKQLVLFLAICFSIAACGPKPWDEPPLHEAAKSGDVDTVKSLLDQGINVNAVNNEGATPLHWAAFKGQLEVAKVLVANGARVNATTKKGSTPLRLATTHKQKEMVRFLKSKGAR